MFGRIENNVYLCKHIFNDMRKNIYIQLALLLLLLSSCGTPNVAYFNDITNGQADAVTQALDIRLRPDDKLSIVVKSRDPQLTSLFNLPVVTRRVGPSQSSSYSNNQDVSVYTVDPNGEIDFPVLGKLKVMGLCREEVAELIKNSLINQNLVKDPVVAIEFVNLNFSVLGEVKRPGRYDLIREHMTVLDAISMAGDLTIQGERGNVLVIREVGDQRVNYRLNLQSARELMQSPAFYLQQNDVVYVAPNKYRSRDTTVNGNRFRSASFWVSVASFATSLYLLISRNF